MQHCQHIPNDTRKMDKWAPIAPSKPGASGQASGAAHGMFAGFGSVLKPLKAGPSTSAAARVRAGPKVGRWPEDILVRIAGFLPVHDVPAFARAHRALARLVRDETTWQERCRILGVDPQPGKVGGAITANSRRPCRRVAKTEYQ